MPFVKLKALLSATGAACLCGSPLSCGSRDPEGGALSIELWRETIVSASRDSLPDVSRRLWAALASGTITVEEAETLGGLLERRTAPAAHGAQRVGQPTLRVPRPARPRPAESLQRRRRWAASGYLPPRLAHHFTGGETAALSVIAETVTKRGSCDLCHGQVAALAGVSISTVKRAIRAARLLGLVSVRERRVSRFRSDSNVLTITSSAWCAWLSLGPKGGRGGGGQSRTGTNTSDSRKAAQRAGESILGAFGGRSRGRRGRSPSRNETFSGESAARRHRGITGD